MFTKYSDDSIKKGIPAMQSNTVNEWEDLVPRDKAGRVIRSGHTNTKTGKWVVHENAWKDWHEDKAAFQRFADLYEFTLNEMKKYGWGEDQMPYLYELWMRESKWNKSAANPESTARGIPQMMASDHMKDPVKLAAWMKDSHAQIKWGLAYIYRRPKYGSPQKALEWHNSHNWY
jgi:hypothetical protein